VRAIACAGELVITGDATGELVVRDEHLSVIGRWHAHDGAVTALATLLDGRVISAGEDGNVNVWTLATAALMATWSFDDHVRCLAIDDTEVLCGGYDGELHRLAVPVAEGWRRAVG
jgi:hypothetical protein